MKRSTVWAILVSLLGSLSFYGCYSLRGSSGGGETTFNPPRVVTPSDIQVPEGYRIEPVATGLTFPTGVAFDDQGGIFVVESGYAYGEVWTEPRLLRILPGGGTSIIAGGGKNGPWTGVAYHQGNFFVAEGGVLEGGRILRITPAGEVTPIVTGLPSMGDHHTNGPAVGPDGWIYFSQGTATNSGVVGEDNAQFGWLKRRPDFHDTPCTDLILSGENHVSKNPLSESSGKVSTGAFVPFGTPTRRGDLIKGKVPCSGAIMRVRPQGGNLELVAWGFRNPFGLAFSEDGRLFVTENQYDERGSRPIYGAGDLLWEVKPGQWHGWPDYHGVDAVYEGDRYRSPGDDRPRRLLDIHPGKPPLPVAVFGVHSSSNGFDFSRSPSFGHVGQAFVAQWGDEAPTTGGRSWLRWASRWFGWI